MLHTQRTGVEVGRPCNVTRAAVRAAVCGWQVGRTWWPWSRRSEGRAVHRSVPLPAQQLPVGGPDLMCGREAGGGVDGCPIWPAPAPPAARANQPVVAATRFPAAQGRTNKRNPRAPSLLALQVRQPAGAAAAEPQGCHRAAARPVLPAAVPPVQGAAGGGWRPGWELGSTAYGQAGGRAEAADYTGACRTADPTKRTDATDCTPTRCPTTQTCTCTPEPPNHPSKHLTASRLLPTGPGAAACGACGAGQHAGGGVAAPVRERAADDRGQRAVGEGRPRGGAARHRARGKQGRMEEDAHAHHLMGAMGRCCRRTVCAGRANLG